jgi:hypothetical protein
MKFVRSGETVENEFQRMILNSSIEKIFVKLLQNFSSFFNFFWEFYNHLSKYCKKSRSTQLHAKRMIINEKFKRND